MRLGSTSSLSSGTARRTTLGAAVAALGATVISACSPASNAPPAAPAPPVSTVAGKGANGDAGAAGPAGGKSPDRVPPAKAEAAAKQFEKRRAGFLRGCRSEGSGPEACNCVFNRELEEVRSGVIYEDDDETAMTTRAIQECAQRENVVHEVYVQACVAQSDTPETFCECSWTEVRKTFSPAELNDAATVTSERFKAASKAMGRVCAQHLPESTVRELTIEVCSGGKSGLRAYCACRWTELRKRFSIQAMRAEDFEQSASYLKARPLVARTCDKLASELDIRDVFIATCSTEPKLANYCRCAWDELRKHRSPMEFDAKFVDAHASEMLAACGNTLPTAPAEPLPAETE